MNTAYHFNHLNASPPFLYTNAMSHTYIGSDTRTEAEQVNEMRTQAFKELQQSTQSYNDSFVLDMRYQEKQLQKARMQGMKKKRNKGNKKDKILANYGKSLSSDEGSMEEDIGDWGRRLKEDRMMDELTVIFQAGSVNDYTPVLDWESKQNMPDSDQLTYGM